MDVTGKCWVVLVESNFDGYISQRIYFHQPADLSRGIHVETKVQYVEASLLWMSDTRLLARLIRLIVGFSQCGGIKQTFELLEPPKKLLMS